MLVHPAASELNTQPVQKIPFINAVLARARVPTLSSSLSLTDGRGSVSLSFFFFFRISFNFCRSCTLQTRLVSLIDIIIIVFSFVDIQPHSVRYILPNYDFASARTPLKPSLVIVLVSFAFRSLCSLYSIRYFDLDVIF